MEIVISIFLGFFLVVIGGMAYYRINKDYKGGNK